MNDFINFAYGYSEAAYNSLKKASEANVMNEFHTNNTEMVLLTTQMIIHQMIANLADEQDKNVQDILDDISKMEKEAYQ